MIILGKHILSNTFNATKIVSLPVRIKEIKVDIWNTVQTTTNQAPNSPASANLGEIIISLTLSQPHHYKPWAEGQHVLDIFLGAAAEIMSDSESKVSHEVKKLIFCLSISPYTLPAYR